MDDIRYLATRSLTHMLHENNPYEATLIDEATSSRSRSRFVVALWWFVYLHPVIALSLIYLSWVVTTVSLGRPPGFGEHPDNGFAHGAVHALGLPGGLLSLAMPVLIPIALMWGFAQPFLQLTEHQSTVTRFMLCLAGHLLMVALVVTAYHFDPWGVLYWFWD